MSSRVSATSEELYSVCILPGIEDALLQTLASDPSQRPADDDAEFDLHDEHTDSLLADELLSSETDDTMLP